MVERGVSIVVSTEGSSARGVEPFNQAVDGIKAAHAPESRFDLSIAAHVWPGSLQRPGTPRSRNGLRSSRRKSLTLATTSDRLGVELSP